MLTQLALNRRGRKQFFVGADENFYLTRINGQLGGQTKQNVIREVRMRAGRGS